MVQRTRGYVIAVGSWSFIVGLGALFSFDFAFLIETLFDGGAASALASVSARVRFNRAMTIRDAIRREDEGCKDWTICAIVLMIWSQQSAWR